jgi:hypothetical protein
MDRTCAAPDPAAFPDGEEDKRYARYRAVDKDGLCMVGELLDNGTVMVNKECESRMCCLLFRIFMMSSSLSILNPSPFIKPLQHRWIRALRWKD